MSDPPQSETRPAPALKSVVRRMVCALVLIPIVPSVAVIGGATITEYFLPPSGGNFYRWFSLCLSSLTVLGMILIWRKLVAWTLGRKVRSALISMIPFVQVVYAQPLRNAGCVLEERLQVGQECLGIAVWTWLLTWVWWGCERLNASGSNMGLPLNWRTRMYPRIRAVVASIGCLPFTVATFFILAPAYENLFGVPRPYVFPTAYLTTGALAGTAWILIWKRQVTWSGSVLGRTLGAAGLLIGLPATGTILIDSVSSDTLTMSLGALPAIGWGVWMAGTVWLWPFKVAEGDIAGTSPCCLKCGYLLKGLTHTRCPECGDERTLDELWAANAAMRI